MKGKSRLIPKSRLVKSEPDGIDTVKQHKSFHGDKALDILFLGMNQWSNLSKFRETRARAKRYVYGDQWKDKIPNPETGGSQTEEQYIIKQGSIPLKNNLIRRLVNNVLGVYLNQDKQPICKARDRKEQSVSEVMTTTLECNWTLNGMSEINAMSFEEFLISGMTVQRKTYGWRDDKADCWTDYVSPNYFFIDSNIRRPDGKDAHVIGEIHDITFGELCMKFAHNAADYDRLKHIYAPQTFRAELGGLGDQFGHRNLFNQDYFFSKDPNLCRVIEIWTKESKPRYRCVDYLEGSMFKIDVEDKKKLVDEVNAQRKAEGEKYGMPESEIPLIETEWCIDEYWYYRFLSPLGDILDEGESPYDHKEHPYVCKFFPFIDGEIHSFAEDVIDQQRYVNRLITLYDWIMRSNAKGVFFAPDDCLPEGMTWEDFAEQVTKVGGIVRYKVKPHGQVPQQVFTNSTNIGISDLLQIQLKFFEDISGVHGAIQGKSPTSSTSGILYAQQMQNGTNSLMRLLQAFSSFICESAKKDVKNIQQFYTTSRLVDIVGSEAFVTYNPNEQRDIDYDIKIAETRNSPTMRAAANEFLIEIWRANQISLAQLLECGDFPFADKLLESIKAQGDAMAAQQQGGAPGAGVPGQEQPDGNGVQDSINKAREQLQQTKYGANNENAAKGYNMIRHALAS